MTDKVVTGGVFYGNDDLYPSMRSSIIEDCKERERDLLLGVLRQIAVGRDNGGQTLSYKSAQQMARDALASLGYDFERRIRRRFNRTLGPLRGLTVTY